MTKRLRTLTPLLLLGSTLLAPLDSTPVRAASDITVESRIAGDNRYATANALALAAAVAGGSGNTRHIVVASGTNFPDGLSAASLAGATNAVMLLTPPTSLPDSVITTIGQIRSSAGLTNSITTATIVGGESAVSANVKAQLEALGLTVARIQGSNRFDTANNVAREAHRLSSTGIGSFAGLKTVFLATGANFPDSLAASSWSYRNVNPVLLSNGRTLDDTTRETLRLLGVQQVLILGGTAAVSADVESALAAVDGVTRVRRLQGANRFATAAAIADAIAEEDPDYSTRALLVSGSSFPDALAAAPLAGQADSYAIVPVSTSLPSAISTWLTDNAATLTAVRAVGGTSAVPQAVVDAASGKEPAVPASVTWTVTSRTAWEVKMTVRDTSKRNLGTAPTLDVREWYVTVKRGTQTTSAAAPLQIEGVYRNGTEAFCSRNPRDTGLIACIGFPLMQSGIPDWRDIGNHPKDVSLTLDILLSEPTIFGAIRSDQIWYEGYSMGGITGLSFVNPINRDPRIKAIVSGAGFAPFWGAMFKDAANWNAAPPILMRNSLEDEVITYDLVRATMKEKGSAGDVTLLTFFKGKHTAGGGYVTCQAMQEFEWAWVNHHVFGAPAPDLATVTNASCGTVGLVAGPSTGWGTAAVFVPADYRL